MFARVRESFQIDSRTFLHRQRSFPVRAIDHLFLFELEVAKIQTLWHILQRNGRERLAGVLYDILAVHFRKDYAVSHLFSAAFLEERYPELESNYWELLQEPSPLGTITYAEMLARDGKRPVERTHGNGNTSFNVEDMALGYPPSKSGGDIDSQRSASSSHEGKFRGSHHPHCPDFVPHGPNMA
jgi:hypothetical protein